MDDFAIKVENVSKTFKLPYEKQSSVKSMFVNVFRKKKGYQLQKALDDVSFEIKKGEFFGIVGRNGSGKSTLLKLLAGIYTPTRGQVQINGNLTPFIELGVGFNPELTGRENVYLNGALLGFNRKEMRAMYQSIVQFAELEKFMDQKLKNYSSGMQVRLAFSIAIRAQSDILLIDEVLAVGDAAFQAKCFEFFRTLKNSDKTVVFVSHDRGAVQEFCERAALVNEGDLITVGTANEVIKKYDEIMLERLEQQHSETKIKHRGQGGAEIIRCEILRDGKEAQAFMPEEEINIRVTIKFNQNISKPTYGLVINRVGEQPVFATNTKVQQVKTTNVNISDKVIVAFKLKNIFGNGRYFVSPAVASEDTLTMYDWRDKMKQFSSSGWSDDYLPVHMGHTIEIEE